MESQFGSNFSDVRVHTDSQAAQSASKLQADAYTTGQDIYFGSGKYEPASAEGQHLIAHELTHTIQQEHGDTPVAASRAGGVLVGDASDSLEAEAEQTADAVVGAKSAPPQVSKDSRPAVRRGLASGAAAVWDATGGRVVHGAEAVAEAVWDEAKETAAAFINRMFPGLLPLLRNASNLLYEKITSGMDAAFNGIASRVRKQGVGGAITGLLTEMAGAIGKSLGQLVTGSCHSVVEAAGSIIHFVKGIAGDAFKEFGKIAKEVGTFFSGIWHDYGAPALEAIQKVAGEAWTWIKDKAQWVWDKLLPIRNGFARAWNWIKREFNIAKEETAGVLDWLYDKAKAEWMKIRDKIAPILGPLKIVAGALLLFSPLGPILLVWKGAPLLWQGLQWIWTHGLKPAGEKIRAEFREHILPYILQGIGTATAILDQASDFLCGFAGTISTGLHSLESALAGVPFFGFASRMVGIVAGFFENLAAKGKCKFSDVIAAGKAALQQVYQVVKPVLEVLRQAVLIGQFGPLALIDDGVWRTFTSFIAFVKRTPCIREIAGLFQIDFVVGKITEIRTRLKDIYEVVTHQDRFEAAIHQALDASLAKIPGQVEAVLGRIVGLDGPHLDALMKRFIAPKVAQTIARAPAMLIDMVWGLVWPWPAVIKDYDEIKVHGGKLKTALWDFEFSKAIDEGLAIWRGVNGIIGQLYGWFFLAAVLIGAVFGAPQAGAAVAYEVGEVLLASTLIAEGLTIEKARFNLMSSSRQAEPEADRQTHDDADYESISGSVINLAVMGALAVLSEIAVDFAKAIFAEIKGIFKPRGVEAPPVELPANATDVADAAKPTEPVRPGEPPRPAEPTEPVPEDALADAEKKGVPREELEPEINELRQRASDPNNVHRPSDPAYDAEMEADGHTFDREKGTESWCRHSIKICDLNLGDDVNAAVDNAIKDKPAEPAEPKPAEPEPVPPEKPSFKKGESDGGPGKWGDPTTPRGSGTTQRSAPYQEKVTGAPPGTEYKVPSASRKSGAVDFDGYDPQSNTLLDAKDYKNWPPAEPAGLRAQAIKGILKEAADQVAAAHGTPIEWHAPTPEKVAELQEILSDGGIVGIEVKLTPK
jgi:hypothetical protein